MTPVPELPDVIPLFPLPGALLLPRARLPLQLFEPCYLQMLEDALKTPHRLIGMIQPRDTPQGAEPRLHAIGCAGRVTGFTEGEGGRCMITLTGLSRFHLKSEIAGFAPYRRAEVAWGKFHRDLGGAEVDAGFRREGFLKLLGRYFRAQKLATDWSSLKDADDEMLINALSMLCPFEPADKQALLESPTLTIRRETLVTLLEFALRSGNGDEVMQ